MRLIVEGVEANGRSLEERAELAERAAADALASAELKCKQADEATRNAQAAEERLSSLEASLSCKETCMSVDVGVGSDDLLGPDSLRPSTNFVPNDLHLKAANARAEAAEAEASAALAALSEVFCLSFMYM